MYYGYMPVCIEFLFTGADVKTSQDKFLVQAHTFPDNMVIPKPADLITYWKSLPSASLSEHRYLMEEVDCTFIFYSWFKH